MPVAAAATPSVPLPTPPTVVKAAVGLALAGVHACFSGLVDDERKAARQTLVDLGGVYAADWDARCTHLVAKALVKSDKQTQALAKGVPIVSPAWLAACKAANARVAEAAFSLTAPPPVVAAAAAAATAATAVPVAAAAEEPPAKKAKAAPAKKAAAAAAYEKPLDGGKKLVKTASNRYILEDPAAAVATTAADMKVDATDELTEAMVDAASTASTTALKAAATTATTTKSLDDTLPLVPDAMLGKGAPLFELPDLFAGKRLFFHFADPLSRDAQRTRALARAFGAQVDDFVEDETHFLVTDRSFDAAMEGAREDNDALQVVSVAWFNDCLQAGKLVAVVAKHKVPGDR